MKRVAGILFTFLVPVLSMFMIVRLLSASTQQSSGTQAGVIVLYDGALDNLPADQGFDFLAFPTQPAQVISTGGTVLDTTSDNAIYAGYFGKDTVVPRLDRSSGFTITLNATLLAETHATVDRAGFSLIVLSDDQGGADTPIGIELGFWSNEIWAQDDDTQGGSLFTHAEGATVDTTSFAIYQLVFSNTGYTLLTNGTILLTGRLRDYTGFTGFPDPYETPNLLFFGDDTSSASARVKLDYVAVEGPWWPQKQYLPLLKRP